MKLRDAIAPPSPKVATLRSFHAEKRGKISPSGDQGVSVGNRKRTDMKSNDTNDMFYGATAKTFEHAKMPGNKMKPPNKNVDAQEND